MALTHSTEHEAEALAMLLQQFRGKEKIEALLSTYTTQIQALEDAIYDVLTKRSIDTAEGAQLDGIGQIVNLERNGREDEPYRDRLRIEILINNSRGTTNDVLGAFRRLLPDAEIIFTDEFPAGFNLEIVDETADGLLLAEVLQRVKAAGVRAILTFATEGDGPFFSFGPDPDADGDSVGFDDGAFVSASG